jgi:hypothetical protein
MLHAESSFGIGAWALVMLAGLETACFVGIVATLVIERAKTQSDAQRSSRPIRSLVCRTFGHRWRGPRTADGIVTMRHCTRCTAWEMS